MEIHSNKPQIRSFIIQKISILFDQYQNISDAEEKLKIACKASSFAQILKLYFQDQSFIVKSSLKQAQSYLALNSYEEALLRARFAKRYIENTDENKKQEIDLLIIKCLLKSKKIQDAQNILLDINPVTHKIQCYMLRLEILAINKDQKSTQQILRKMDECAGQKFDQLSVDYGEYMLEKGKKLELLCKYQEASVALKQSLNIFIANKVKDKKKVSLLYENLARCSNKLNNLENQLTSLMCGESLIKNIRGQEKNHISIMHRIVQNMLQSQSYSEALNWLFKVRDLQKSVYGEYSQKIAKTIKSICAVLQILGKHGQSRKYEHEYQKISGTCSSSVENSLEGQKKLLKSRKLKVIDTNCKFQQ